MDQQVRQERGTGVVLVFDGSRGARAAAVWAACEAALRGLERSLRETLGEHPPVSYRCSTIEDHLAEGLLTAAAGAGLLVVGRRPHHLPGSFALGSVSLHCAAAAACPVVTVPPPLP